LQTRPRDQSTLAFASLLAKRAKPPGAEDLKAANITTWEDIEELLKTVKTKDSKPPREDPRIKQELEDMRRFYPKPSPRELEFFVNNVSPILDFWPALDARRAH
jgi:hypothetical protein